MYRTKEKMKIILINNFHYLKGGSEAVYFNTAELLKEHGHEVIFFSFRREENTLCNQEKYFVNVGSSLCQLKAYFYNKEAAQQLEKLLKAEKPDIAHVHLFWGGLSPSIFKILKKHRVPLVHTAHDYRMVCPSYTFKDGAGKACERCKKWNYYQCALHRCSKGSIVQSMLMTLEMYIRQLLFNPLKNISGFVFVSHFSEQKHIEHQPGFQRANRIVLYNYTNPLFSLDLSMKDDYFLFFGRLSFEKGIPTLLKVFARHPELQLKIVGTGPLEETLKAEYPTKESALTGAPVQPQKCYENIQFVGYHSGETLAELVRSARFVCVPSECYENNPMTIVESYSYGTPIIGADIGGIPEILDEGITGYLFKSGDVDDLDRVISIAASVDEQKYINLCNSAYEFYRKNFSEQHHYERLIDFYQQTMASKTETHI